MDKFQEAIQWQIKVPIFKDPLILKQLGIAIGIPFGILALVIGLASGRSIYTLYALGLVGALLFFTWLFIMVVYRGKYEAEFLLDARGALCRTQAKQSKKNRFLNALTVVLGVFSGKLSVAGAGVLAQSKQAVFLRWNSVKKVSFKPQSSTILLRGSWTENIALFCTLENYNAVEELVRMKTKHAKGG